jgi:hypothetical protein
MRCSPWHGALGEPERKSHLVGSQSNHKPQGPCFRVLKDDTNLNVGLAEFA